MLTLHLRKGVGLKAAHLHSKSGPYMQCSIGAQKHTSKVAEKTLDDPVFNEELEFEGTLHELLSHGLHLKVLDKDCLTRGDSLGELQVSLEAWLLAHCTRTL